MKNRKEKGKTETLNGKKKIMLLKKNKRKTELLWKNKMQRKVLKASFREEN
jgi:hypothetical protein